MSLPPTEAQRSASLGSTSTRGAATAPAPPAMEDHHHGGHRRPRGRGGRDESTGGAAGSASDRVVLAEQQQALQAMESMSLASPYSRGTPSLAAAAGSTDLASWNDSPAMLQRELVAARMNSAQARAREFELHQRIQALSPSVGRSPAYLQPPGGGLVEVSPVYAAQLVGQNQALAYPQTASRSLPLGRELDQLRAARGQAMMSGIHPGLSGAPTILSSVIPPPPLTGADSMGSSSARGIAAPPAEFVSQLPTAAQGDFGLRAVAHYPTAGPASIHAANFLAAEQERADLLRRMQQQQQMVSAGPVLRPVYGAPSTFHGPTSLLMAREQRLQQLMLQQQRSALSGGVGYPATWIQTNESNVAETSPSRSLRVLPTGGLVGPTLESVMLAPQGDRASPRGGDDPTAYQVRGTFIGEITELDVLCGRGGRSNHWPGNKRYRRVISEMKNAYKSSEGRKSKTGLSRSIVDHVLGYGGRFVREEEESGRYYVLTKAEARVKTSQALREGKDLKWTG